MISHRFVQLAMASALLFGLVTTTWGYWVAGYKYFAGNAEGCGLTACLDAARITRGQIKTQNDITKQSKVVQRDGELTLVATPHGEWWTSAESLTGLYLEIAEQVHDIYGTGDAGVRKGDIVLDCGANIGIFVRKALDRGARRVIAIEPVPITAEALQRNFAAEVASGRVVVYRKGVWDHEDVLPMHVNADHTRDSFLRPMEGDTGIVNLPLTTIDKIVAELGLERVDFIKMDIEGAERQALLGATGTIRRFHPRMSLCLYHEKEDPVAVPAAVRKIDVSYRWKWRCLQMTDNVIPEIAYFH
jgi:FkbM family methyltransferase